MKEGGGLTFDVTVSLTLRVKVLRISMDDRLCNLRIGGASDAILHVRVEMRYLLGDLGRSDA